MPKYCSTNKSIELLYNIHLLKVGAITVDLKKH